MTLQDNAAAPAATRLRFIVTEGNSSDGLKPGDVLEWDALAPHGHTVVHRRVLDLHVGHLDRMMLRGVLVPQDVNVLEARQAFVASVVAKHSRAA